MKKSGYYSQVDAKIIVVELSDSKELADCIFLLLTSLKNVNIKNLYFLTWHLLISSNILNMFL